MNKIAITEAAKFADITREKARYWARLLKLEVTKQGRISYIPEGSETIILAMAKAVSGGLSPSLAANEVLTVHALPVTKEIKQIDSSELTNRINSLEQAVMLLVEQNTALSKTTKAQGERIEEQNKALADTTKAYSKRIEEQNKFIVASLQAQNNHLKTIQFKLDPPQKQKQIEVWKPTEPQRPKYSTIQRIWYEVTNPEKLRAN